jgi:hypothetical protein
LHQSPNMSGQASLPTEVEETIAHFVRVTGLRADLLARLRVDAIDYSENGALFIAITDADGNYIYDVPVLAGREAFVLSIIANREPHELVFPHLPKYMHLQDYRIHYAHALYDEVCANNEMGYDQEQIIHYVMHALGEKPQREKVRHYLGF